MVLGKKCKKIMGSEDFRFHTSLTSPIQNLYHPPNIIRG